MPEGRTEGESLIEALVFFVTNSIPSFSKKLAITFLSCDTQHLSNSNLPSTSQKSNKMPGKQSNEMRGNMGREWSK
jgi:hypothetical protein